MAAQSGGASPQAVRDSRVLAPSMRPTPVSTSHGLFFAVFRLLHQIAHLHRLKGWRERSRRAVCLAIGPFLNHRVNDSPERRAQTRGDDALSTRFREGVAGGSVPLGSRTRSPEFEAAFDWPDVVTPVACDEHDTAGVLADLSSQPDRLAAVRTQNVRNSLRRQDGSARWSHVPGASGLPLTPPLEQRIVKHKARADTVDLPSEGSRPPAGTPTRIRSGDARPYDPARPAIGAVPLGRMIRVIVAAAWTTRDQGQ